MPTFGSFALIIALVLAIYSFVAGTAGLVLLRRGGPQRAWAGLKLNETARRAGIAVFYAVTAAAFVLLQAAITNDFSVAYILHHSNRALPLPYKVAALWSGQEGSLLFWAWLLSSYGLVLRLRHKVDVRLVAHASVILAAIQVFFLLLLNFAALPFALMTGPVARDGNGLNPLLQYAEMVIHPPMLYLGYVGFSVPFAFALGALIMNYPCEKWIHTPRRWTMVSWLFRGCGIALGSHWAYSVLAWGGYWGWDPVEDAAVLPWFTATAFLHSVMVQERRSMLRVWNVTLVILTFFLTIFGTFLTRSGVVQSVHAFGDDPQLARLFTGFMVLILTFSFGMVIYRLPLLKARAELDSWVSREAAFLVNNWILLFCAFFVAFATMFPTLSEAVTGTRMTVGPPFFNKWMLPIGLVLLFLTGLGPMLAWRKSTVDNLVHTFAWPVGALVVTVGSLAALGVTQWAALTCLALCAFVTATIVQEFWRGAKVRRKNTGADLLTSLIGLVARNKRRYGGYIVHVGIVLIFLGFAGNAYKRDVTQVLEPGKQMTVGAYTVRNDQVKVIDDVQKVSVVAYISVFK